MTLFSELANRKLGTPKGLKDFIYYETDYQTNVRGRPRYVDCIELYKGKLLLRTFAYHNVKKSTLYDDIEYQEVCRRLQAEKQVLLCNIENSMYCGRSVYYGGSGWCNDHNQGFVYTASNKSWYFGEYKMYDEQEIIDMLNIHYCQWFTAKKSEFLQMTFFDYICAYLDEPKIEYLVKADLIQFVHVYKRLNFKAKSLDKIFKINNYWTKYITKLEYTDLLLIRNKNHKINTYDDLIKVRKIMYMESNKSEKKYTRRYARPCMLDFISKLDRQTLVDYEDYLRMCDESGIEITNSVVCSQKWKEEHDRLAELAMIKNDKKTYLKTFNAYKELLKYVFSENDLVIVPCEKVSELETESNELNHCVKTYAKRYMKRETNIMFIRNIKNVTRPYVTLEFVGKKVIQCRCSNNKKPNDNVVDFVNNWCKNFKLKSCFN